MQRPAPTTTLRALAFTLLAGFGTWTAEAVPQRFAYSYEANTLAKGSYEFENNVNWAHSSGEDEFEFEHEFEFGITDRLQVSLLAEWAYADSDEGSDTAFLGAGVEAIYQLTNPSTDAVGSALLFETKIGDEFTIESKLLLQKDFGPVTCVYNVGAEAVWEGDNYNEENLAVFQSFGVDYKVTPNFMVGVEGLHEMEFADWSDQESNGFFLGPNVAFRSGGFWVTAAGLWQVTDDEASPDFQGHLRIGYNF